MRRVFIAAVFVVALAVPSAHAGGWATVVLAPPAAGLEADETWTAEITVLRHGRTPTDGALPSVTIRGLDGQETFRATPAGKPGAYIAHVTFPSAGSWRYEVNDGLAATGYGYSQTHTYASIDVAPGSGGGGGGVSIWPFALVGIALVAGAAAVLVRQRSRPAELNPS